MHTVKMIMDYIRVLQIPLVWKFNTVTATFTRGDGTLVIETDSTVENCQRVEFLADDTLLLIVEFLATCTITGTNLDGTYISEQSTVFDKLLAIIELPVDYRKQSSWLINQYEQGNKLPLIDRAQELAGDLFNTAGGSIEENYLVIEYYRNKEDAQALGKALDLARELRVALSNMSVVAR